MTYVTNQVMNDLMTTAIEGGSAYWMNDRDVCCNVSLIRNTEKDVVEITCYTSISRVDVWEKHDPVQASTIRKALVAMKADEDVPAHLRKLASGLLNDPDYDYDSGDADIVFQYALFGSIVFG